MAAPPNREMAFLKAAFDGDLMLLERLASEVGNGEGLTKGYEMVTDGKGRNALHFAAAAGNTPLLVAILSHQHPTVVYLIEKGVAAIDCINLWGHTALHLVAEIGQKEITRLLLSKGAKVEHDLSITLSSPLECACSHGKKECVKLLLDNGADPNSFTKISSTPLMSSVAANSYECMELLLKAGADPNIGLLGRTPLLLAVDSPDARMIKRLLKAGANANVVDSFGLLTPLEMAAMSGNVTDVKTLFPFTSRISSIPEWSVDGIMKHCYSEEAKTQLGNRLKDSLELSKAKGREAFEKKDYEDALNWYTQAGLVDPTDAAVVSNRSLCWVRLNQPRHALDDAKLCVALKPDWAKAHYRMGAAWMLVNDYSMALEAFSRALRLDPNNMDIKKAHREALEAEFRMPVSENFRVLHL